MLHGRVIVRHFIDIRTTRDVAAIQACFIQVFQDFRHLAAMAAQGLIDRCMV